MKTKMLVMSVILASTVVTTSALLAQADSRRDLTGGYGGGGPGSIFTVAANEAVQAELGLNKDVSAKVSEVLRDFSVAWNEAGGAFRTRMIPTKGRGPRSIVQDAVPTGNLDGTKRTPEEAQRLQSQMLQTWQDLSAKFSPELKELLTADQWTRLQQIYWQALGSEAYAEKDVIEKLAITKPQQTEIRSILDHYRDLKQAVLQDSKTPAVAVPEKIEDLSLEQEAKVAAVLNLGQLSTFQRLKGEGFDFAPLLDPVRLR